MAVVTAAAFATALAMAPTAADAATGASPPPVGVGSAGLAFAGTDTERCVAALAQLAAKSSPSSTAVTLCWSVISKDWTVDVVASGAGASGEGDGP